MSLKVAFKEYSKALDLDPRKTCQGVRRAEEAALQAPQPTVTLRSKFHYDGAKIAPFLRCNAEDS
ncbi:TPA: hypothetical protein ACH3X2_013930 [Trebouxia sp. C0005]